MANTIFRLNPQDKVLQAVGLFCLMLLVQKGGATEFKVGGSKGWAVPTSEVHYNQWAENTRFQIGDSVVFDYQPNQDSVLQVDQDSYNNCNTDSYQQKYTDGHTVIQFSQSGPFYFISGNKDNCLKNEKIVIIVLADRSNRTNNQTNTSPPPSGSTNITPAPAPSGEESPSPPAGSVDINPTPGPVSDQTPPPPPSGASSILINSITSFGAFTASSLYFLL